MAGGITVTMADPATPEIALEQELREQRQLYVLSSGTQPTVENLFKSLTIQNARGDKGTEVITALKLIMFKYKTELDSDTVTKAIIACYDGNPDSELIQVVCADSLVRIDNLKGVALSRKILDDPKKELETKLRVARNLIAVRVLIGYPVLREGLITPNDYTRKRLGLPLLDAFAAYDGSVYGEHGEKVDIHALIADVKKNAKEQKVIYDLEKAELK